MTMATLLRLYKVFCLIRFITCACKYGAKPCEWEPWKPWSSCSRTCGVGYRTRNRNMCCGPIFTDCASNCFRGDNNKQVEVCNDSCPNGATLFDGICQCPPLKYGICCDVDESAMREGGIGCARHCAWLNWYSWGDCSTSCGCGSRKRTRVPCCKTTLNYTQCVDDCNMHHDKDTRPCTKGCSSKHGRNGCSLCSWNNWGSWSTCNSPCGGGQRSRSRSPCCCTGQKVEDCLSDCKLLETDATQKKSCNQHCFPGGRFYGNKCDCKAGFTGKCCSSEVMVSDCKKCSWQTWQPWKETGEDGKMRRTRELCCRIGQSAEDCMSKCEVDEHSQVQTLMNTTDSTHPDLYLYLYAGGSSLASVIVTSLVWACCSNLKKKRSGKKMSSGSGNKPGNVYQMSVRGQEMDDWYEDMDDGANQADNSNYANMKF